MNHRPPLLVQLGWELILLLALLAVTGFAARDVPLFEDGRLLWSVAYLGLLASALAFSFRLGTPNLALVGAATLSMVVYGNLALANGEPPVLAAVVAVVAAGILGVALALAADRLDAPVWAITFAGQVVAAMVVSMMLVDSVEPVELAGAGAAVPWLLAFLVISIGGGVWFAFPAVRHRLAGLRAGDGQLEPWVRLTIGLTGSSLVGGLAGVAAVLFTSDPFPSPPFGAFPMFNAYDLLVAFAAVLLGGVSIRGEQGGIAGTALAITFLTVLFAWLDLTDAPAPLVWLVLGLVLLAGFALPQGMRAVAPAPMEPAEAPSEEDEAALEAEEA